MKKQKIQLLIMLIALIVLGGGYFGLRQYNKAQSEKEPEPEGEVIVSLEKEDIIRFSYDYEGNEYSYEKEEDTWYYAPDPELTLTQYRLTNIVSKLAELTAQDTITGVTDMSQYGLEEPQRTFSFETESETYTFYVGDRNDISGVYYICKPGEDTVYTVATTVVTTLNLDVQDIVEEEESTEEATATEETETTEETAATEEIVATEETTADSQAE